MSVPFHKQTDPAKMAGQHRYGFDREPYLKHSNAAPDVTLSDYIARKEGGPKKITFKEWLKKSSFVEPDETTYCWLEDCWNAAIKHGKIS